MKFIVGASSNEGDLVLDCFCGSGTTLVAAQLLNRNWIGIDQSPLAIKVAEKKLYGLPIDLFTKMDYELLVQKELQIDDLQREQGISKMRQTIGH